MPSRRTDLPHRGRPASLRRFQRIQHLHSGRDDGVVLMAGMS